MASRIAGITVEINGNVTGLNKALESVNKTIKNTQSQLKDVERLLKLDPTNTQLLTQKQGLLKDSIAATKDKLDALKTAQEQAKTQMESGDLGKDKYDALQREIIATEEELSLVTAIDGYNEDTLNNVIYVRTGYNDIYQLIDASLKFKSIVLLVPMYCSNPSSLYFVFNERMQDYFSKNSDKWDAFASKTKIIAIFGSEKETPLFIPTLSQLVNGDYSKILKIERHIYNLKMEDRVIDNSSALKKIDLFLK